MISVVMWCEILDTDSTDSKKLESFEMYRIHNNAIEKQRHK